MKREEIEKAAKKYANENAYIPSDGYAENNMIEMKESFAEAFKDGAEWRINSVWHDMKSEEPQVYGEYENEVYPQIPCLVRGQLSTGYGYGVRYWNTTEKVWDDEECDDFECKKDDIEEWAYLDDLIPNVE